MRTGSRVTPSTDARETLIAHVVRYAVKHNLAQIDDAALALAYSQIPAQQQRAIAPYCQHVERLSERQKTRLLREINEQATKARLRNARLELRAEMRELIGELYALAEPGDIDTLRANRDALNAVVAQLGLERGTDA